jgi:predicted XRE-type DNA-binding protein
MTREPKSIQTRRDFIKGAALASTGVALGTTVAGAGWTQKKTAQRLGITQPRVSDLLRGKLSKFSLDALVNMLARLGSEIELKVA